MAAGTLLAAKGVAGEPTPKRGRLRLGIMSDVYSRFPLEEAARRLKADGFGSVVLVPTFADVRFDWQKPDWAAATKIVQALGKEGIRICSLFGYYNVIDPAPERRKLGEARMDLLIENWKRFECPVIALETGTLNADSEWEASPENGTEKAYLACRGAFEVLVKKAEKAKAVLAIEPYWKNVIGTAERAERLFRDLPSPSLRLVMDPCNYFRKEDLPKMKPMLGEIFRRLGEQIVLAHAKDVKAAAAEGTDLPAAGLGVLDYDTYLDLLTRTGRDFDLTLEHLGFEDMPRARGFVQGKIAGIEG